MSAANEPDDAEPALLTRPFVQLLAMQGALGFALSVFLLLPKVLAASFAATPGEIGMVMAAYGLASVASVALVGRAVDLFGQRGALIAANVVMAVGAFGFVGVTGAGALAAAMRALHGLAWSLGFAAGTAIAADLAPPARLAQAVGIFGAASLAMNAIAPAIAEPIGEVLGHRVVFALAGGAALVGAALARRLPAGRTYEHALPPGPAWAPPGARRGTAYVMLCVSGLAFGVMFTFIAPYALAHGVHAVRGFFGAYTVAALAVRVLAGRAGDRIGHRRVACVAGALYGLVVIAVGVLGPTHLLGLGGAFGAAHGAFFPAVMALLLDGARGRLRARVLGLANGSMNLGLASVLVLGSLAGHVGYGAVFVLAGLLMTGGTALFAQAR